MAQNMPEKKYVAGAISATIWKNQATSKRTGEPVEYRTIQLDRRYTDKEGKWQSSNSLRINDIQKARTVLQKAYEYIILKKDDSDDKEETSQEYSTEEIVM